MSPHRPKSRAWFASAAVLCLLILPGPAPADTYYETVYLPTSGILSLPTSSYLSTSYVVPTSYSSTYIPTSYSSAYIPTSYTSTYLPTSYSSTYIPTSTVLSTGSVLVPTSSLYYRPSIFRSRRLVERTSYSYLPTSTILPTSYLMPTTYSTLLPTTYVRSSILAPTSYLIDDSVVTTSMSSLPCETAPSVAPTRSVNRAPENNGNNGSGPAIISEPTSGRNSNEPKPTATLNNGSAGDESTSSRVEPPVTVPQTTTPPPPQPKELPKGVEATAPLKEPSVVGESGEMPRLPANPTKPADGGPAIPGPGQIGNPAGAPAAGPNDLSYRQARKPTYDTRNVLRGKVVAAGSDQTVEGVTVILSNLTKKFVDRQVKSDADGEFKVSLPDGDWTVKVQMPSGSILTVGVAGQDYLTASGGKIIDSSGQNVNVYVINR